MICLFVRSKIGGRKSISNQPFLCLNRTFSSIFLLSFNILSFEVITLLHGDADRFKFLFSSSYIKGSCQLSSSSIFTTHCTSKKIVVWCGVVHCIIRRNEKKFLWFYFSRSSRHSSLSFAFSFFISLPFPLFLLAILIISLNLSPNFLRNNFCLHLHLGVMNCKFH